MREICGTVLTYFISAQRTKMCVSHFFPFSFWEGARNEYVCVCVCALVDSNGSNSNSRWILYDSFWFWCSEKTLQMPSSHSFCNEYFCQFVFICRFSCARSFDSVHSFASSKCKFKRNFAHSFVEWWRRISMLFCSLSFTLSLSLSGALALCSLSFEIPFSLPFHTLRKFLIVKSKSP